jgi:hypothetical protein
MPNRAQSHRRENTVKAPLLMTLDEKLDTIVKTVELEKQGKFEEAKQLHNTIPVPPYMVKFLKDHIGLDALLKSGLNLSEAEAEYGSDFISR